MLMGVSTKKERKQMNSVPPYAAWYALYAEQTPGLCRVKQGEGRENQRTNSTLLPPFPNTQ